jgi:hypothetical protein
LWGKQTQLTDGTILGMTGRRRSSIDLYVPFAGDHTLGTGLDPTLAPVTILDEPVFEQIADFPVGYCAPPDGASCAVDRFYADPSWAPDGRAFIAYTDRKTYVQQGTEMYVNYSTGSSVDERLASLGAYLPADLGIALIDRTGAIAKLVAAPDGNMLRDPVWIGPRAAERIQPWAADETKASSSITIADFPLWLSFRDGGGDKRNVMTDLDRIVAVRVLEKTADGNACENDGRPYRYAVNAASYDHPTDLGINNASGYRRLVQAASAGGDAWGDVPLAADRSVRLKVPAGALLLFQGVDANGHVVRQHERVFALPPGETIETGVKRDAFIGQCAPCHGTLDGAATPALGKIDQVPRVDLDFDVAASFVDLTTADPRPLTFQRVMRPLLDDKCVSCHGGAAPAGELSLEADYSPTGNYPAGKWATSPGLADPAYLAAVPAGARVPAYNYSVTFAWDFREDEQEYRQSSAWAPRIASNEPLAALAPWDPAYQNLFANDGNRFVYLSGYFTPNFGRGDRLGGASSDSFLVEVLSGQDLDPTRAFTGPDHTGYVTEAQRREIMALIDVGFPYAERCDDRTVPDGPNAGRPWGDPDPAR